MYRALTTRLSPTTIFSHLNSLQPPCHSLPPSIFPQYERATGVKDSNASLLRCEPGFRTHGCACVYKPAPPPNPFHALCILVDSNKPSSSTFYRPTFILCFSITSLLVLLEAADAPLSAPTTRLPALFHWTTHSIKPFGGSLCPEFPFPQTMVTVFVLARRLAWCVQRPIRQRGQSIHERMQASATPARTHVHLTSLANSATLERLDRPEP